MLNNHVLYYKKGIYFNIEVSTFFLLKTIFQCKKITPLNSGQGFTVNMITGLLVTTASVHGMPFSTAHVFLGSIFGIGTVTKKADYKMIGKILLSWLLTLPITAIVRGLLFLLLKNLA